jgi:acetyltransferase-like isoleucine patch superfamily enzyme
VGSIKRTLESDPIIQGFSKITKSIPSKVLAYGNPAKIVRSL